MFYDQAEGWSLQQGSCLESCRYSPSGGKRYFASPEDGQRKRRDGNQVRCGTVAQIKVAPIHKFFKFKFKYKYYDSTLWLWVYDSVIQWFSEVILDSQSQWSKTYALAALSDRNKKQKEILTRIRGLLCRTVENMDKCCNSPGVAWASAIRKWTCCVCATCLTLFASHRWPMKNHESWSHEPWTLNLRKLKILNAFFCTVHCTLYNIMIWEFDK